MKYLEAREIVANLSPDAEPLRFVLGMSGEPAPLEVFLRAAAATRKRAAIARSFPFGTMGQALATDDGSGEREVFLLFPWDFVPEADWRSGMPKGPADLATLESRARDTAAQLAARKNAGYIYVCAPIPPLFSDPTKTRQLRLSLESLALSLSAKVLPEEVFSLGSYLANGCPISSAALGVIADHAISLALAESLPSAKVLVTDLDHVMWHGVIGEDGLEGIHYRAEGLGYPHFIYQTFLAKLKRDGVLLAAVSRNDLSLANEPFQRGEMVLKLDDLVVVVASYNAKSAQIAAIASQLNLGLDSFVFVDDNAIEIEEVKGALPGVRTVQFPTAAAGIAGFLAELAELFRRDVLTAEDADRTAMYRRRLDGMVPSGATGSDLTTFLRSLEMTLTIHDRSVGDRARAVQLINKTNQFNLNGRRVHDADVGETLASGGKLYTCALSDRTGSHGEILACLIDETGTVQSLVMSCRVFQRRVEDAFFSWLADQPGAPQRLDYLKTERNEPIRQFLSDPAFTIDDVTSVAVDMRAFAKAHRADLALFALRTSDMRAHQTSPAAVEA